MLKTEFAHWLPKSWHACTHTHTHKHTHITGASMLPTADRYTENSYSLAMSYIAYVADSGKPHLVYSQEEGVLRQQ